MEPRFPRRKPSRLRDFDYSHSGRYFITICTYGRSDCLGWIENGIMHMNPCGEIVLRCIEKIAEIHSNVRILSQAVMPDHIHFVMEISDTATVGVAYHATRPSENTTRPLENVVHPQIMSPSDDVRRKSKMTMPKIVQQFKTATLKAVRQIREETESQRLNEGWLYGDGLHEILPPLYWQRGYYDRIIRTGEDYESICEYIETNPLNWYINEHLGEYVQENEELDRPLL